MQPVSGQHQQLGYHRTTPVQVAAESAEEVGDVLAAALTGRRQGESVVFRRPVAVNGLSFQSASVLKEFKTKTAAVLVSLQPGGVLFICKFEDIRHEHALMCALRHMNRRWQRQGLLVFGRRVEALTYTIIPLGSQVGLIEVVPHSKTLRELAEGFAFGDRHLRVVNTLGADPRRLDRLAATTVAYLTAGYALGIRDGHDDNIMLNCADGALFRIDLGFSFGGVPEIDAPSTFVPNAVRFALGEHRWEEVVSKCGLALQALCAGGRPGEASAGLGGRAFPAWDLIRSVPELKPLLPQAYGYVQTLSIEDFGRQVRRADEWTFSRAMKNTLREAVRYVMAEEEVEQAAGGSANSPGGAGSSSSGAGALGSGALGGLTVGR
mmetsp:Transcript_4229/g.11966  ORF Transcript_4229/g.11966 Transcript_4229/m.11966 type:complete len:379 (-) Transcript_4229:4-1140(-)